jgi:hypothetical protein
MQFIEKMNTKKQERIERFLCILGTIISLIGLTFLFILQWNFIKKFHTILFLLLFVSLLFSLAGLFKNKEHEENKMRWLYDWFRPFLKKENLWKTILIFTPTIIIPLILYHYCKGTHYMNDETNFNFISNWGIVLSFFGILVGMKIYIEMVESKKKHNFEEFINILCNLFDEAEDSDEINLLLPTLHIGAAGKNKSFSKKFKDTILKKAANGNIKIGILQYNVENVVAFRDKYADTPYDDLEEKKQSEISTALTNNNDLLFQFHKVWNFSDKKYNHSAEKYDFYYDLADFIVKLAERANNNKNFIINQLNKNYFCKEENGQSKCSRESNEGLFLYVNKTKNRIYFGKIYITAQERIEFHNTTIRELAVGEEFSTLSHTVVANHS